MSVSVGISGDFKENRGNRHNRKVVITLDDNRAHVVHVQQTAGDDGKYKTPSFSIEPATFMLKSEFEINLFLLALGKAMEIAKQMSVHTGKKARGA